MEIRRCLFVRETKVGLSCNVCVWPRSSCHTSASCKFLLVILGYYEAKETNLMMFFLRPRNDLTWKGKVIILSSLTLSEKHLRESASSKNLQNLFSGK